MKCFLLVIVVAAALFLMGCGDGGFEYNGLYWQVGPDRDLTWNEAKDWVDSIGGDWRMPSEDELIALWDSGIKDNRWGPFENSGWWVWYDEFDHGINFYGGPDSWSWPPNSSSISSRAFAVREQ